MHELVVHAQHVQHKFTCMGVTPVQGLLLDCIYIFLHVGHFNAFFMFRFDRSCQHEHCLQVKGGSARRHVDQFLCMCVQ